MKVQRRGNAAPQIVVAGDKVTIGVTHQFVIGGENSWVKYEVEHKIGGDLDQDEEVQMLLEHVDTQVMECIEHVVNTVKGVTR